MTILETIFLLISMILGSLAPALLAKAVFVRRFSFMAYCIALAILLTEEIYRIAYDDILLPPRSFTRLTGALSFFVLTIIISKFISIIVKSKTSWLAIVSGSFVGTIGVFIIASLHFKSMQPLYPLSSSNPLFGIVDKFLIDKILAWSIAISLSIFVFRLLRQIYLNIMKIYLNPINGTKIKN